MKRRRASRSRCSVQPQTDDAAQDVEHRCDQLVDHALTDGAVAATLQRAGTVFLCHALKSNSKAVPRRNSTRAAVGSPCRVALALIRIWPLCRSSPSPRATRQAAAATGSPMSCSIAGPGVDDDADGVAGSGWGSAEVGMGALLASVWGTGGRRSETSAT